MSLKKLSQIQKPVQIDPKVFGDWDLVVTGQRYYYAFSDKNKENKLGVATDLVIADDRHDYGGEIGVNVYARLTVKEPGAKDINQFKAKQRVKLVRLDKARVWGEFLNNLALEGKLMAADEVDKLRAQKQKGAAD